MKERLYALSLCMASVCSFADMAKVGIVVVDEMTRVPIEGATVKAWFQWNIGWRAWSEPTPIVTDTKITDKEGFCRLEGKTNVGEVGVVVQRIPGKYYSGSGDGFEFKRKNLFGVWQPDNLVATIRLQRVEHPIPLCVKRVELRDYARGIGGFDGTNSVLRFDLMKGDWLPPYGKGEVADMRINSKLRITDKERKFRYSTKKVENVLFYELVNGITFGGGEDFVQSFNADATAGIKLRTAEDVKSANETTRVRGMRKKIAKNKNWHCEYFTDSLPDRCYTFRIRSRRNEKGELVEAYYGKIYGDFEFEGDDKKGLIGVKFLYYLNPKSLDRNLEWDMKTNLCPTAGKHESQQP